MKKTISFSTLIFALALVCAPLFASATAGAAPVDGGLSILVAAGIGYGSKKLAAKKNKKLNDTIK